MYSVRLLKHRSLPLFIGLMGMLALLGLAACSTPGQASTQPTATPDAHAILQQAANASYTDVSFDATLATTLLGQQVNGTGNGALTKNPQRMELTLTLPVTAGGTTINVKVETITDYATQTTYTRTTTNGVAGAWTKSPLSTDTSGSNVDITGFANLSSYSNVKLIGSETVNGVAVWHLQASPSSDTATATTGTSTTPSATATTSSTTVDIYVRQDNSYPYKIAAHVVADSVTSDISLTFTKYNSGVTITLPTV